MDKYQSFYQFLNGPAVAGCSWVLKPRLRMMKTEPGAPRSTPNGMHIKEADAAN